MEGMSTFEGAIAIGTELEEIIHYRNNPLKVFKKAVNISNLIGSEDEKEQEFLSILEIIREIIFDESRWSTIQRHEVKITPLLGGTTNQLLLIERNDALSSSDKLVFRLFGEKTTEFIHRPMENTVMARLSSVHFGPLFYGGFLNGRIEQYLPGRALTPKEMTIEPNNGSIAAAVAKLHSFKFSEIQYLSSLTFNDLIKLNFNELLNACADSPSSSPTNRPAYKWLWDKIELFFDLAKNLTFPTEKEQQQYEKLDISNMYEEFQWFKQNTQQLHYRLVHWNASTKPTRLDHDRLLGRLFALEEVLCHNDLTAGNVLFVRQEERKVGEAEKTIKLIDYEYAGTNYRAYDFANHFCEYAGLDFDIRNNFPDKPSRLAFIKSYIAISKPNYAGNGLFAEGVDDMALYFTLASNLLWGPWGIVQAKGSTIDFDYFQYAAARFDGYFYLKNLFYDSSFYQHA